MAMTKRQTNETLRSDMWRACDIVRRGDLLCGCHPPGGRLRDHQRRVPGLRTVCRSLSERGDCVDDRRWRTRLEYHCPLVIPGGYLVGDVWRPGAGYPRQHDQRAQPRLPVRSRWPAVHLGVRHVGPRPRVRLAALCLHRGSVPTQRTALRPGVPGRLARAAERVQGT